ncbi:DUF202 domain-containing protein [Actibacterium sp. XHP0104]|uniref:DUF202 domain-containing protein n=1 Tax=Actibacterium sp. XHP0104 TaxID=2984335 RepID=UPI0021E72A97|nr:DUF202 domain-containing protein [Actibacterium sp. XHP0104]MCV2882836.1 DUF202 domain-containing protein [Actibacterium sp. XHP0104]
MSTENDKSQQRTEWSEDRTLMANERTYSSWIGTGLGAIGVALGLRAVFGSFEPVWAAKLVASVFLAAALAIFWAARNNACKTHRRLNDHDANPVPPSAYTRLTTILTVATLATGAILWSL